MRYKFQCTFCYETLEVTDDFVGRTIMCPMCQTPLTVPANDPNRLALTQDFNDALTHFKLTEFDRAYARKALELKLVEVAALRPVLENVIRAARHGKKSALNDELIAKGAIDKKTNLVLHELVKGGQRGEKIAECPNCFAAVPAKGAACPFCAQKLNDLLICDMCPNCKRNQPRGSAICRICGADIESGLKPSNKLSRCPRCEHEIRGEHLHCPVCRTELKHYFMRTQMRRLRTLRESLWANAFTIFFLLCMIGGAYAWHNWSLIHKSASTFLKGEDRTALDERLRKFDIALKFDDITTLTTYLDPQLHREADESMRLAMLGSDPGTGAPQVEKISHEEFEVDSKTATATVYTRITGTYRLDSIKTPDLASSADLEGATKSILSARNLNNSVPWKWVRIDEKWYYSAPLQKAVTSARLNP